MLLLVFSQLLHFSAVLYCEFLCRSLYSLCFVHAGFQLLLLLLVFLFILNAVAKIYTHTYPYIHEFLFVFFCYCICCVPKIVCLYFVVIIIMYRSCCCCYCCVACAKFKCLYSGSLNILIFKCIMPM